MKQKTFFTIAAIIFIIMAVYFTTQMSGSSQRQCSFDFYLYCLGDAFEDCPNGVSQASIYWSCCVGDGNCGAVWTITCEDEEYNPVYTACSCDGEDPAECGY